MAVVPTSPNTAVRATLSRGSGCAGAPARGSGFSGRVMGGVAVLGEASSIGGSLSASRRYATAGDKIFMKLQ